MAGLLAQLSGDADVTIRKRIVQDVEMGRPSLPEATAIKESGVVRTSLIGGTCVPMMQGSMDLV